MKEDKITNAIAKHAKNLEEKDHWDKVEVEPEAHYNHYGTRGIADLYQKNYEFANQPPFTHLYEIKSTPRNANEVIRQFQKMRRFFFKDESRPWPHEVIYELCFTPEKSNLEHVEENFDMYRQLYSDNTRIMMRHPENIRPVHLVVPHTFASIDDVKKHAKVTNEEVFDELF
jgi:hypothetical protein